jgi:hypothetical protein
VAEAVKKRFWFLVSGFWFARPDLTRNEKRVLF